MKKKAAKPRSQRASVDRANSTVGKIGKIGKIGGLGGALTSTASFAAGVARETKEIIRNLASSVTKSTEVGPSPGATDLLVHQHRLVEGLFERLESSSKGFDQTFRELAHGEAGVDENARAAALHEHRVSRAPTPQQPNAHAT